MPRHRFLSRSARPPSSRASRPSGLSEAALYWDAQVELPERLVLDALRAAAGCRHGGAQPRRRRPACVARRLGGSSASSCDGTLDGRSATRDSTGRVINATGPWADVTLAGLGLDAHRCFGWCRASTSFTPRLAEHAVAFEHPDDRRLCFAVPWQGMTMIGTTERDVVGGPDEARVTRGEVAYLVRGANRVLPASNGMAPLWGSVGVRSLVREAGSPTASRGGICWSITRATAHRA